jgi:hypothetical protein
MPAKALLHRMARSWGISLGTSNTYYCQQVPMACQRRWVFHRFCARKISKERFKYPPSPTHPIYSPATLDAPCTSALPMQLVFHSALDHTHPWNGEIMLQISSSSVEEYWPGIGGYCEWCRMHNLCNLYIQSLDSYFGNYIQGSQAKMNMYVFYGKSIYLERNKQTRYSIIGCGTCFWHAFALNERVLSTFGMSQMVHMTLYNMDDTYLIYDLMDFLFISLIFWTILSSISFLFFSI